MDSFLIKPEHLRATSGYCMAGAKNFCRLHGIDFKQFVRHGTPAQLLIDSGDALALELVEKAKHYERQKEAQEG